MEKNRKILLDTLRKLPVYTPDDEIWEALSSNLKETSSLNKMPALSKIEPPEFIWTNIDNHLNRQEKLAALTQYEPPHEVWENIEQGLNDRKHKGVSRRSFQWIKWASAVAALFVLGFFISKAIDNNNSDFTYSEEWVEIRNVQQWTAEDTSVELALNLICLAKPLECKTPEFKELKKELSFLNQSKQEILRQLNKYDTNTELEIKLTEIELERSNLIKELIAKTI